MTKRRVYTKQQLCEMPTNEWLFLNICMRAKSFRLLGMNWENKITWHEDSMSGDLIFEWD